MTTIEINQKIAAMKIMMCSECFGTVFRRMKGLIFCANCGHSEKPLILTLS